MYCFPPLTSRTQKRRDLILGGRRWCVDDINTVGKLVLVSPSKGGKTQTFRGAAGEIHNRVVKEMRAVLSDVDEMPYLDGSAQTLLKTARVMALRAGVLSPGFIVREESVQWFPWLGSRGLLTLELHARCDGLVPETDLLSITYKKASLDRWRHHLESIQRGDRTALDLAQHMVVKTFEKFDDALAEDLLDVANAHDRLDLATASSRAEQALNTLRNHTTANTVT